MRIPVGVIILTYNEEVHIGRCLKNISNWADEIFIVDSFSTDKTLEIAKKYGAKAVQHEFENQAQQFNWALDNLDIRNEWILRLDADEYLTEELKQEIGDIFNIRTSDVTRTSDVPKLDINGFYIKRRVYFMNRWIKHGGYYPVWFLRLFKKGKARYEQREVDEHLVLSEKTAGFLKFDFVDDNKNDLFWWTQRINNYTSREVLARLREKEADSGLKSRLIGGQAERKRWLRKNFYYKLPLFIRAFIYFFYRYIIRFGFLDGKEGLIFHFLQGCWNQFLVDAKIYERLKKEKSRDL